jgi:hypothetical protein
MTKQPIRRFRAGAVSCAIWENEIVVNGQTKPLLKATVDRRFKDRNGEWKSSQSFSRTEIPLAIYCLTKAFVSMIETPDEPDGPMPVEEIYVE